MLLGMGNRKKRWLSVLILMSLIPLSNGVSAGQWTLNTSLQFSNGNYIYTTSTRAYYFYGGLTYNTGRWNISVSVPLILQNTDLIGQAGGMFFPTGEGHHDSPAGNGMRGGRGRRSVTETTQYEWGLGDTYLAGEYQLLTEKVNFPSVSLNGQIKIPTASTEKKFGTGELDWSIGISLRKMVRSYLFFVDGGFLNIGDPSGVTYRNPFYEGIGMGKFLMNNNLSFLLYFQNYSRILDDYDPPRQISLGTYYKMNSRQLLSLNISLGLSETSPDYLISMGLSWSL